MVKQMSLREKLEKRKNLAEQANVILRQQSVTKEDRIKVDQMFIDVDKLTGEIEAEEREKATSEVEYVAKYRGLESPSERNYRMAYTQYIRGGESALTAEHRRLLTERRRAAELRDTVNGLEAGTQSITYSAGTAGGFLVPAGFVAEVAQRLKYFAPLMSGDSVDVIDTETGSVLPFPVGDDTSNVATLIGENTQVSEDDVTLQQVTLGAYKYTSGVIRVSMELLQDSAIDLDSYLAARFGERFGRAYEAAFTTGTGSNAPTGIVQAMINRNCPIVIGAGSSANDGVGPAATTIGTQDLIALEHQVDPAYRAVGKFMLSDNALKVVRNLLDKFGHPIWQPSMAQGAPSTINGYPYVINQSLASVAASANSVIFGDLKQFKIRRVKDMSILRLSERYADYGQTGFVAFSRVDSNLVLASGANALAILQQHS
jgi:HK97 family phage major capsid protein